jgi:hypothetical protein
LRFTNDDLRVAVVIAVAIVNRKSEIVNLSEGRQI